MKIITVLYIIPVLFGLLLSILILSLLLATIFDYRPKSKIEVKLKNPTSEKIINKTQLTILSWNIGYAGLGKDMDFFYDGGEKVRPTPGRNQIYLEGILDFLHMTDDVDFVLLQEVDHKSKRSYFTDQVATISERLSRHNYAYAPNYKVPFVPVPPSRPMGKVFSGLMTLSTYDPVTSERRSFPGNYAWPKSLFMLDRCFLVQRFKTSPGRELVLINTHNSAFDDGQLREQQMQVLREFSLNEYQKGNFVILGGDWNQNPPGFDPQQVSSGHISVKNDLGNIPENFMPKGWTWAFDPSVPTNRNVVKPYRKGETPTTIIDFFLVSPNIDVISVKTENLNFNFSDHNPVNINFRLQQ